MVACTSWILDRAGCHQDFGEPWETTEKNMYYVNMLEIWLRGARLQLWTHTEMVSGTWGKLHTILLITYSPSEQRDFVCARKPYGNSGRITMKLFPDAIFVSFSVVPSDWKFSDLNPQSWREGTFVGPKLSMWEQKKFWKSLSNSRHTKVVVLLECDTLRGRMQLLTSQSYVWQFYAYWIVQVYGLCVCLLHS